MIQNYGFIQVANLFKKIISSLEDSKLPFYYYILTFFFSVTLRNFIEIFSDKTVPNLILYLHYYASYFALAIAFIIVFYLCTKTPIKNLIKLIFSCYLIIILAPILDIIISRGQGFDMGYFQPDIHKDIVLRFFSFFGAFNPPAFTIGMRIEIAIILLLSFCYIPKASGRKVFSSALRFLKAKLLISRHIGTLNDYGLISSFIFC